MADESTPGERAEFDQAAAAAREIVDALIESSVDAYTADPDPSGPAAKAWGAEWLPHLRGLATTERMLIEMEMLRRLSMQALANRRLAATLARVFEDEDERHGR